MRGPTGWNSKSLKTAVGGVPVNVLTTVETLDRLFGRFSTFDTGYKADIDEFKTCQEVVLRIVHLKAFGT